MWKNDIFVLTFAVLFGMALGSAIWSVTYGHELVNKVETLDKLIKEYK